MANTKKFQPGLLPGLLPRDQDGKPSSKITAINSADVAVATTTSSMQPHDFKPYRKITQKTDIWVDATPTGKTASVSAGFDLILVDN